MQPLMIHSEFTSGYRGNTYFLENEGGGGGGGWRGGRKEKAIYKSYKIYLVAHPEEVLIILVVDVMNKVSFDVVKKLWLH